MEENNYKNLDGNKDLLSDLGNNLVRASTGKRFANYIIDLIVFIFTLLIILVPIAFAFPSVFTALDYGDDLGLSLLDRIISLLVFGLYMSITEGLLKGKSVGKYITKTRAVNEDGTKINWQTAFQRGFSRVVPFEQFSALSGYPWHDKWSDTIVIDEKLSMKF